MPELASNTLMVAVSTGQNTANAVPALQLGVSSILLVETEYAQQQGWSKGLCQVLKKRRLKIEAPVILDREESSRIDLIQTKLLERLENYPAVIFNLGGGQKAQQIAIWDVFNKRNNSNDRVTYANMGNGQLELWQRENGELKYTAKSINCDLRVEEILRIFNKYLYSYEKNPKNFGGELFKLYEEGPLKKIIHGQRKENRIANIEDKRLTEEELKNSFLWKNFHIFLGDYYRLQNANNNQKNKILESLVLKIVKQIKNSPISENLALPEEPNELRKFQKILSPAFVRIKTVKHFKRFLKKDLFKAFAEYKDKIYTGNLISIDRKKYQSLPAGIFSSYELSQQLEQQGGVGFIFETIVYDWLKNIKPQFTEGFVDILKNAKIKSNLEAANPEAEHDFLFATKKGTLVSLDAKIGELPQKDLDARLLNLSQGSGAYAKFCVVLPLDQKFYEQDLIQPHVLNTIFKLHPRVPILGLGFSSELELKHSKSQKSIRLKSPEDFFAALR
ncbi:hypothetical protein [Picosynechococcus sp. NKBG042902]|uniref:hypothetical protein n=1 Tax=Picosynechococcus sp. NKBG042902 TaxID=490193 RepID=UPI0004AA042C|nr:hypothetical protein [Picosynechococcus sp. NKBG042902]